VTLARDGTATHQLTITYSFNSATFPAIRDYLFNADWYLTYLRVYVPPGAHLAAWAGFSSSRGFQQIGRSDDPERQMWGGYVLVRDGVPYSLHFTWSVPGAGSEVAGQMHYALTVQHQAGSNQQLHLTIAVPGAATPVVTYAGALDQDRTFGVVV
jgi:hypothetical protein